MPINVGPLLTAGGSLLGPTGTAIGSALGAVFSQQYNQDQQNNYNADMQSWQEKMWNMNNQYNTPLAQRKRMEEAGLNPQLMYGQGTVGNSSAPPSVPTGSKAPQSDFNNAQLALTLAQAKNIEADTANKLATNPLINKRTTLTGLQVDTEEQRGNLLNQQWLNSIQDYTFKSLTQNDRASIIKSQSVINQSYADISDEKAKLQLRQMNANIESAIASKNFTEIKTLLDKYEAEFRSVGLSFRDELQYRIIFNAYKEIVKQLK
jgi:hypothetical protein